MTVSDASAAPPRSLPHRLESAVRRLVQRPARRLARAARFRAGLEPARSPVVFCIAMQRTGTTSFGRFCAEQLGLVTHSFDVSIANSWPQAWIRGEQERIFSSPDFRTGQVFEDDPWWYPRAYELLAPRFPEAKFVLITRDADAWFRSLMAHSNGRAPGHTEVHAAVYGREEEYRALVAKAGSKRKVKWQGLSLAGHETHYKAHYLRHAEDARAWFAANAPDRFLEIRLDDPQKFTQVAEFLGFPGHDWSDVHVNAIASPPKGDASAA